jgi:hypothetical protein
MTTTTTTANDTAVHPFERAGLGRAPFRYVGMVAQDICYGQAILNREEYQRTGILMTTKPGGTCAYCGQYIVQMFNVRSADGRTFHVGCDCIRKVDEKLAKAIKADVARAAKAKRVAADKRRTASAATALADEAVRAQLAAMPHPTASFAARGETLLAWCDWTMKYAGAAGRAKVAKVIAALPAVEPEPDPDAAWIDAHAAEYLDAE